MAAMAAISRDVTGAVTLTGPGWTEGHEPVKSTGAAGTKPKEAEPPTPGKSSLIKFVLWHVCRLVALAGNGVSLVFELSWFLR